MSRPLARDEKVVLGALALVVVGIAFRAWAVIGSWFYSDDFIFLGDVASDDAHGAWYLEPHNVHFMPFSRWLIVLVGASGEYSWAAAAAQILVLQVIAIVTCWWMLRTLFGDRPGILVPLALFILSPATMPTAVWWAAAINQLPHQIALMGAVAAHVRYLRAPSWSRALLVGAFLVLGYASYTKSILIPVLLAVLTVLYFAWGPLVLRLREAIGRHHHVWIVVGGLSAAYAWLYTTVAPSSPVPTLRVVWEMIDLSVVQSAVPSLFGGPWQWQSLGQPGGVGPRLFVDTPLTLAMLSWCLVVALTMWQSLRYRRVWWPVMIVLGYAILSALVIAVGRATAFGPAAAGLELRYFADLAAVASLGLGLAMMPLRGAHQSLELRDPPLLRVRLRHRWVTATLVATMASAVLSSVLYVRPWHDDASMPQKAFIERGSAQVAAQDELFDTGVPDFVIWSVVFPKNLASRIFSPVHPDVRWVTQGVDLKVVDTTGAVVRAQVGGGARNPPGPVPDCGYLLQPGESVTVPVAAVVNFPWTVGVNYLAELPSVLSIKAGDLTTELSMPSGLHTGFVPSAGAYDQVIVTHERGFGPVCIDSIAVGGVEPLGGLPVVAP